MALWILKGQKTGCLAVLILMFHLTLVGQTMMDTTLSGLPYKIYTDNSGRRIGLNDVVTVNFIQKKENGDVLIKTFESGAPVKIQIKESRQVTDLMDFFILLTEKDSALVKIPSDSIFVNYETSRPADLGKGSWLLLYVKIERVQTYEEVMSEALKSIEGQRSKERQLLAAYLSQNKLNPSFTASGLGYIVLRKSHKTKPSIGDTVFINYTARDLSNKVIDTSIEEEAKKAGIVHPGSIYGPISFVLGKGEVIRGWDEGVLLMHEGAKMKLFIPSKLAFDWEGSGEDIEPFTTLVIDIELMKIKRSQKRK
jgi:FKBP-type peptidyl-prolyl cis-trans isomerase FkpA